MSDDDLIRRGDAIAKCRAIADEARSYGMPQMAMGGYASADAIAAIPATDARAEALREAAAIARHYAETDYCAMGYPEDGGIAASGTAHTIEGDILALIAETKP